MVPTYRVPSDSNFCALRQKSGILGRQNVLKGQTRLTFSERSALASRVPTVYVDHATRSIARA